MADSRYDSTGRNESGRRKIGYKPRTTRDSFGGLNSFYALQNRNIPAFDRVGGGMNANDWGQQISSQGMELGRDGTLRSRAGGRVQPGAAASPSRALRGRNRGQQAAVAEPTYGSVRPLDLGAELGSSSLLGQSTTTPAASVSVPVDLGQRPNLNPAATPQSLRRGLQERAQGLALQRSVTNPAEVATVPGSTDRVLRSKYGTGSSTSTPSSGSTINGQSSRDFFQDSADRQGVGNRFASASKSLDPKKWRAALTGRGLSSPKRSAI